MRHAFVTGGSGFIGKALIRELLDNNWKVTALYRANSPRKMLSDSNLTLVEGDLTEKESLLKGMKDCDTVFHCAALYREAKFPDEMYWKVNFEGTKLALEAAKESGIKYFLHCSTTGVLGNIENPPADENYRYGPLDVYQESKTEAEKLVLNWFREGKINGSVIRPTMVWGPEDTRLFKLFKGIYNRTMPIIGSGKTLCHWVLVQDLVRGFRMAAENPATIGKLYFVGGERTVTLEYTMQVIADFYKVKLWPFKFPVLPVQIVGSIVEAICKPFGIEPPIHRRRVDFYVKNRSFVCSKAETDFGYKASHTFEEEAKLVAKWYLDNGWLKIKSANSNV